MAHSADHADIAEQARRIYAEHLVKGLPAMVNSLAAAASTLLDKPSEHARFMRRRELVHELKKGAAVWHKSMVNGLRNALLNGVSAVRPADLPPPGAQSGPLSLVDDDTIEREILTSRLALAVMDQAASEFTDLRARMSSLERREELDAQDMLRAHVLARIVVDAWRSAGCSLDSWRELQPGLHEELASLVEEAYHETNRWLVEQGVLPDVDLHPYIKRSRSVPTRAAGLSSGGGGGHSGYGPSSGFGGAQGPGQGPSSGYGAGPGPGYGPGGGGGGAARLSGGAGPSTGSGAGRSSHSAYWAGSHAGASGDGSFPGRGGVGEETRMMTRAAPLARSGEHAEAVLGRLNRLVGRHLPAFSDTSRAHKLSPALAQAIDQAQQGIRRRVGSSTRRAGEPTVTTPALMEELHQRKQALKQSAATPEERATIEIVALLFQSILTEDRIPASVRVWFARLQMPVLRVAVTEPDFFATVDHPARRLIDRMGACVMGFDTSTRSVGDALEKEIKRVVQVVEAYPDTGRRVFQTVLTEFEKFLEHYFSTENEATRKGVSLAQQVEQRETMAIQYTIELRRMLNEMPVQESVRAFLFQVWADVLATTAVRYGAQGEETRAMKRAASDLIWSASAKVTREERAEVIRRLTPLLKTLARRHVLGRHGCGQAGRAHPDPQQLAGRSLHRQGAGDPARAAAGAGRAAGVAGRAAARCRRRDHRRLDRLRPVGPRELRAGGGVRRRLDADAGDDRLGARAAGRRLVHARLPRPQRGGATGLAGPAQAAVDVHHAQGRCVLFQQQRLASFLQAGLLLPAQDESLSVRATRSALAKLDVDPSRLLN